MSRWPVGVALVAAATAAAAGSLPKNIVGRVTSACVLIQAIEGQRANSGSGFFVARNEVLTNYHVVKAAVDGDARIAVVVDSGTRDRQVVEADLVGADEQLDLALLRTKHRSASTLRFLRESQLRVTQDVWVAGYPFGTQPGLELTLTAGTISSLRHNEGKGLRQVQIDASINPGNSGGPVVDDKGRVAGVTRAVVSPKVGAGMAIAIPCGAAEEFVKQARKFRRRTKSLRLMGRTSRKGLRILRAEKIEEPWGTTVQLSVRGARGAEDVESFSIELADRRRDPLKTRDITVENLQPREKKTIAVRLKGVDFDDIAACRIVD